MSLSLPWPLPPDMQKMLQLQQEEKQQQHPRQQHLQGGWIQTRDYWPETRQNQRKTIFKAIMDSQGSFKASTITALSQLAQRAFADVRMYQSDVHNKHHNEQTKEEWRENPLLEMHTSWYLPKEKWEEAAEGKDEKTAEGKDDDEKTAKKRILNQQNEFAVYTRWRDAAVRDEWIGKKRMLQAFGNNEDEAKAADGPAIKNKLLHQLFHDTVDFCFQRESRWWKKQVEGATMKRLFKTGNGNQLAFVFLFEKNASVNTVKIEYGANKLPSISLVNAPLYDDPKESGMLELTLFLIQIAKAAPLKEELQSVARIFEDTVMYNITTIDDPVTAGTTRTVTLDAKQFRDGYMLQGQGETTAESGSSDPTYSKVRILAPTTQHNFQILAEVRVDSANHTTGEVTLQDVPELLQLTTDMKLEPITEQLAAGDADAGAKAKQAAIHNAFTQTVQSNNTILAENRAAFITLNESVQEFSQKRIDVGIYTVQNTQAMLNEVIDLMMQSIQQTKERINLDVDETRRGEAEMTTKLLSMEKRLQNLKQDKEDMMRLLTSAQKVEMNAHTQDVNQFSRDVEHAKDEYNQEISQCEKTSKEIEATFQSLQQRAKEEWKGLVNIFHSKKGDSNTLNISAFTTLPEQITQYTTQFTSDHGFGAFVNSITVPNDQVYAAYKAQVKEYNEDILKSVQSKFEAVKAAESKLLQRLQEKKVQKEVTSLPKGWTAPEDDESKWNEENKFEIVNIQDNLKTLLTEIEPMIVEGTETPEEMVPEEGPEIDIESWKTTIEQLLHTPSPTIDDTTAQQDPRMMHTYSTKPVPDTIERADIYALFDNVKKQIIASTGQTGQQIQSRYSRLNSDMSGIRRTNLQLQWNELREKVNAEIQSVAKTLTDNFEKKDKPSEEDIHVEETDLQPAPEVKVQSLHSNTQVNDSKDIVFETNAVQALKEKDDSTKKALAFDTGDDEWS